MEVWSYMGGNVNKGFNIIICGDKVKMEPILNLKGG